jgi:hypothetical protein
MKISLFEELLLGIFSSHSAEPNTEKRPNKAPEPTPTSVMPRATSRELGRSIWKGFLIPARGTPAAVVAHL